MKNLKRLSLMSLFLVIIISMTACTTNDVRLVSALKKQQEINSLKAKTDMSFELSTEGFDEFTESILEEIIKEVNKLNVTVDQVIIQNEEKTKAKGKMDISGKLGEKSGSGTIWIDTDLNDENSKLVEIIKLPKEMVLDILGEENADKYIVYDIEEIMEKGLTEVKNEEQSEMFKAISEWSIQSQPKLIKFIEDFTKNYDLEMNIVEYKGKKAFEGQKLDMYEINMQDDQFKEVIRYSVNSMLEDQNLASVFEDYFAILSNLIDQEDLSNELENINKEFIKKEFNNYMDKMKDVKLLGKDGIKVELGVSRSGYIVSQDVDIDLVMDFAEYAKLQESEDKVDNVVEVIQSTNGKINFKIKTRSKISNINNKNLKFDIPKLDKENSISFIELMELQEKALEKAMKEYEEMDYEEEIELNK